MRHPRLTLAALALAIAAAPAAAPSPAAADDLCRVVDIDFTPTDELQIVVWLEDAAGNYVETLYLTEATGRRGLGNRPGRMDFNSSWAWPYGRRIQTFPVWAHRHGMSWPMLVFQSGTDNDLSHSFSQSSVEGYYCRPLQEGEPAWDAETCASTAYTDKGVPSASDSLYPPRADVAYTEGVDDPAVAGYDEMNPFDAVTQATPVGGAHLLLNWPLPADLPLGDYVVWVEVSKESDFNAEYNPTSYPAPTGILYSQYGLPYRGQPSVVYRVPVTVGNDLTIGTATTFDGYGDPDGLDGDVRVPDGTIDTDVPGSGAQRLLTTVDGELAYLVRVQARAERDDAAPAAPADGQVVDVTATTATVSFVEPGDDGLDGRVEGYEVRYRAGTAMVEDNFLASNPVAVSMVPDDAGTTRELTIPGLLPQTDYWVGIRAYDDCKNYGPLEIIELTTGARETGEVDACFVATAAYGSILANDVAMLRHVRDSVLRTNVVGELAVEAYYTFGPALAGLIGESEELRGLARDLLGPLVDQVRDLSYVEPPPATP
ncbi:MAG: fibronectin type III domain-containing protein [Kofleriaceae bacterium]|nr:fibronectin type III domain-containing protein [Kofleriaceae bacterium]MCB9571930.1 fibronectin type III domain-containing protein [Kofleriaceae bacterium]